MSDSVMKGMTETFLPIGQEVVVCVVDIGKISGDNVDTSEDNFLSIV